jgi:hypothetical protein
VGIQDFSRLPLDPAFAGATIRELNAVRRWRVVGERVGMVKLENPVLYREAALCQAVEARVDELLGVDRYETSSTGTAHVVLMEQRLGRLSELRDIARDLDCNVRNGWLMVLAPNLPCIAGVFALASASAHPY